MSQATKKTEVETIEFLSVARHLIKQSPVICERAYVLCVG